MKLKYNNNRFRIVQFTDTHIGNMPFHEDDYKTFDLIKKSLDNLKPDLIIHTGDMIWSEGVKDAILVFENLMNIFNEAKIPMAIAMGNHDAEEIITREDLRRKFEEVVEFSAEKKNSMIIEDRESYNLEIYSSDEKEIKNVLYLLDSGDTSKYDIGIYQWNQLEQVNWFREVSNIYKKNDGIKRNILFQHIPLPEYWQAADNIIDGVCLETNEMISAPHLNVGLFSNMVLNEETWGISVGHDHENNFNSNLYGLYLVYGQVSGYQSYGDLKRGVRVFDFEENSNEIKTFTVLHDEFK